MSIPPLVCNTPPPPEQCEDDKEPEDFDLSYNLSQDEDEENNDFAFQTYTSYRIYDTSKYENTQQSSWPTPSNIVNHEINDSSDEDKYNKVNSMPTIDTAITEKLHLDDIIVEDLNLEVNQENLNLQNVNNDKIPSESCDNDFISKEILIPRLPIEDNANVIENINIEQSKISCQSESPEDYTSKISIDNLDVKSEVNKEFNVSNVESHSTSNFVALESNSSKAKEAFENDINQPGSEIVNDDGFSDFDDFQFANIDTNISTTIDTSENPWESDNPQCNDFSNFEANFDEQNENISNSSKILGNQNYITKDNDSDDFGDFDDFKSCTSPSKENDMKSLQFDQQVSVLDFQSQDNENQILENLDKTFCLIFTQEVSEAETDSLGKLELVLNETWGHLVDIDARQPYMINWNNSLGQKSLLKALCIDSRNILFGPKWHYNMPKYAGNLSTAPLQPQKQFTSMPNTETQPDKALVKESNAWSDPFSSNGQEFTYAESLLLDLEHLMATLDQMAHKHSSLKISELLSHACSTDSERAGEDRGATDLDVFEKVMSSKVNKSYSASVNVQPLRQINLPDTHIFTPSDSETPRSKTIHYDSGPSVILSQDVIKNENKTSKNTSIESCLTEAAIKKLEDDNEYWEFQDFKSSASTKIQNDTHQMNTLQHIVDKKGNETVQCANSISNNNISYQSQLLEPIKVEPIVPTLNWPEPGEVREAFDDFSDFVSSSSWSNDKKDISRNVQENNGEAKGSAFNESENDKLSIKRTLHIEDDEFETFQSASPVEMSIHCKSVESNCIDPTYHQSLSSNITNFDIAFSEKNKFSSEGVSTKSNDCNTKTVAPITDANQISASSLNDGIVMSSPIHFAGTPNILQPSPTSASGTSRSNNTVQILQPLSLESYSQINWPSPGIDLQDLSRFNPVETLPSLKSDFFVNSQSKVASPAHNENPSVRNEILDEDAWGEFVSSIPNHPLATKKLPVFGDEDEWTDFISNSNVKPQNGLNTISLNVHTNLNMQKTTTQNNFNSKSSQLPLDIPTLNYVTPKSSHKTYNDKHFQNL